MLETDLEARASLVPGEERAPRTKDATVYPPESAGAFPANWYVLTESFRVGTSPYKSRVGGHDLVLYRKSDGGLVALQGVCTHLGASLARGRIENDCLVCPFHGWAYDETGQCTRIPSQERIPEFARLRSFPVIERSGLVFVHLGQDPTHVRGPAAVSAPPEELHGFIASRTYRLEVDASWQFIASNGFDANHFESVHGRKPLAESRITYPDASSIEVTHIYQITGKLWFERALALLLGRELSLRYRVVDGTLVLAETTWGPLTNRMLFSLIPRGDQACTVVGTVLSRGRGPLARLRRALQRHLTLAFFRREARDVEGARLNPDRLVESDRVLRTFYTWLLERRGTV